jgi:hypothetical protein
VLKTSNDKPPLWACPACGQRFVTRNMAHSCGDVSLDSHFAGKDPRVREVFAALVSAAESLGPVHVYAQRTRIVFQTRGRFVAVTPRKHHLGGHLWLKRAREHPAVHRVESLLDRDFLHHFRLTAAPEIDSGFRELLREAYAVGCQEATPGSP